MWKINIFHTFTGDYHNFPCILSLPMLLFHQHQHPPFPQVFLESFLFFLCTKAQQRPENVALHHVRLIPMVPMDSLRFSDWRILTEAMSSFTHSNGHALGNSTPVTYHLTTLQTWDWARSHAASSGFQMTALMVERCNNAGKDEDRRCVVILLSSSVKSLY